MILMIFINRIELNYHADTSSSSVSYCCFWTKTNLHLKHTYMPVNVSFSARLIHIHPLSFHASIIKLLCLCCIFIIVSAVANNKD